MKNLIVPVLMVCFNMQIIAQRTVPEKKDNLIILIRDGNTEQNFLAFGQFLVKEGFTFESKDKDFFTLVTNERTSQGGYKYKLTVTVIDSMVYVRPKCNYLLFGSSPGSIQTDWTDWEYSKAKKSAVGIAFGAFEPVLRKFNGQLFFDKE